MYYVHVTSYQDLITCIIENAVPKMKEVKNYCKANTIREM